MRESCRSGPVGVLAFEIEARNRRSAALAQGAEGDRSGGFGGSGGRRAGEVAVFEAVAVAFEREDFGVVDEPVDHRGGDDLVAEDLAPGRERLVGGDDHAGAFVAAADEHEHQVGGLGVEWDVADLVDDQQRDRAASLSSSVSRRPWRWASASMRDPFGGGAECDAVAGQAGADAERDREVSLAGPGRAEQDDVLAAVKEVELAEVQHRVAAERGLKGEVELLERLASGESRGLDAGLAAVAVAAVDLGLEQRGGEPLISSTPPARARSASLGSARAAAGALRARNRCASSVVGRLMRSAVIAGQRTDLDVGLAPSALVALGLERAGVLERGDRAVLGERRGVAAGQLAGVQRDRGDLAIGDPGLDAPPDQPRVERVVAGVEAQVWVRRHPSTQRRSMSGGVRQRRHHRAFLDQPVDRAAAQRLVLPRIRAVLEPVVELELVVELVREAAAGLKAFLDEVLQPLDDALGLRVAPARRSASRPAAAPQNAANSVSGGRRRRAARPGDPRPTSAAARPATTSSAGCRPAAPGSAWRRSTRRRRRASSPGTRRRPSPPRLAVPDRDLGLRLPQIELADLARPIDRALKRPRRRRKQRPHLAQVVIEDRLAARIAQRRDQLTDPLPGQLGVHPSSRWISSLNGSSFDPVASRS